MANKNISMNQVEINMKVYGFCWGYYCVAETKCKWSVLRNPMLNNGRNSLTRDIISVCGI